MRTICLVFLVQFWLAAAAPPRVSFSARRDSPILGPGTTLGPGEAPPSGLTIADLNGDGLPDVAVLSASTNSLVVMVDQGDGSFRSGKAINAGLAPGAVVAGD